MPGNYVRFGPFELSKPERVLRRDGVVVAISPKALALLQVLLEAGGQVVAKDRILDAVWPDSFVEEASLPQTISVLRKQLADAYPDESPIANVPRVGYLFRGAFQEYATREEIPAEITAPEAAPADIAPQAVEEEQAPAAAEVSAVPHPASPTLPQKRWMWVWTLLATTVLLLSAGWFMHARVREVSARAVNLQQYTHNESENPVRAAAISPDASLVAYADSDGIILRIIESGIIHSLKSPSGSDVSQLAWYSDGLHLLASLTDPATDRQRLWRISVTAEEPVLLRENARQGVPSPDGAHIAFTAVHDSELWVAGSSGESPRLLLKGLANESFPVVVWSRDSHHLLLQKLTYITTGHTKTSLEPQGPLEMQAAYVAMDITTTTGSASVQNNGIRFDTACLLAPDKLLISRLNQDTDAGASTLWTVDLDPSTGALTSTPLAAKGHRTGRIYGLTCSQSGNDLAAVGREGAPDVYVGDLLSSPWKLENVRRLTNDARADFQHAWTRDSSAVIFESDRGRIFQIYRQALDRHDPDIIASTNTDQVFAQMSPDGRWILYESNGLDQPHPPYKLFRVPAGGGAPTQVSDETLGEYRCPNTGTFCVAREAQGASIVFYALDPMKGKGARIGSIPWMPATWGAWDVSPDGSTIAVPSQSPTKPEITLLPTHASPASAGRAPSALHVIPLQLTGQISAIHWAADGNGWFVAINKTMGEKLFHVDSKGVATFLRETSGPSWTNPSPDGKKLAFVDQTVDSNVWLSQETHPDSK